ncbi:hypothetical protein CAPTEDRAFT_225913 [Capitella teleta]|uniref:Uncharacterized protein n=1 Tax=Capitella teleta TaxID=283909 RepID=R7TSN4_CAPTE|nr:hypothetical protein CAPTEDRAFT_225913 [Capitella teleta]|eukprot:ELT94496.1 hypothetical protein CAPTEDRAFT_225913 [Capitella teleta]
MNKKKRWIFVVTFLVSTTAVGFLSASLATDFWVEANPARNVDEVTEDGARIVTDGDTGTKFHGDIHFGLFHGHKSLDHGLGLREGDIWIECLESENLCGWVWGSYSQQKQEAELLTAISLYEKRLSESDINNASGEVRGHGLFNFGLWLSSIVMVALGIIWGLVSMGFSALNAGTRPIETITGPMGLYLWNALAGGYSITNPHGFVVVAAILYAVNLLVVAFGGIHCAPIKYGRNINEKAMDGVMMY